MQKFLLAFDKCKGSLSASELCELAENYLKKRYLGCQVKKAPLTDGGEGFVAILTEAVNGELHSVSVKNSIGEAKSANIGICQLADIPHEVLSYFRLPENGKLGIVEMAQSAGLADLAMDQRDPWKTSTYGVGEMLKEASLLGVNAILLGIGGSSTNDIGLGALAALGATFWDQNDQKITNPFPDHWQQIIRIEFADLVSLPPLFVACDVDNPLLGENGATAQYGPQKGLPLDQVKQFEEKIIHCQSLLRLSFQDADELAKFEGSGAAGGIGYGLSLPFSVSLVSGFDLISKWFDLRNLVENADLVLTGEGRFDKTSLSGKGPFELLRLADKKLKSSILLAGSIEFDAVKDVCKGFHHCELLQFGKNEWSLERNLSLAEERFLDTLNAFSFENMNDHAL